MAEKKNKDQKQEKGKGQPQEKGKGQPRDKAKGKKSKVEIKPIPKDYMPRLVKKYRDQITSDLQKQFDLGNPMLVPKLEKIVLNVGDGTLHSDSKLADSVVQEIEAIAGQKPVLTRARLSISNFKLRQGMVVGCKVTLRGKIMFEFFDRLISIVIPRIRDFRGLGDKSFDGRGNYTFGVKEQIIFPEIDYDKVVQMHGMDITICTSAPNDEQAFALLKGFGFPFRQHSDSEEAA